MKSILIASIAVMLMYPAYSQREYLKIQKVEGNNRIRKVRIGAEVVVINFQYQKDSSERYLRFEGKLDKVLHDSIEIKTDYTQTRIFRGDHFSSGTFEIYSWSSNQKKKFAFNDFSHLQYRNPGKQTFRAISASLIVCSLVTGLIVAPLVSFDYKEKTFNNARYKGWVIGSAITLGIAIPINLLCKENSVSFTKKGRYHHKIWKILPNN